MPPASPELLAHGSAALPMKATQREESEATAALCRAWVPVSFAVAAVIRVCRTG